MGSAILTVVLETAREGCVCVHQATRPLRLRGSHPPLSLLLAHRRRRRSHLTKSSAVKKFVLVEIVISVFSKILLQSEFSRKHCFFFVTGMTTLTGMTTWHGSRLWATAVRGSKLVQASAKRRQSGYQPFRPAERRTQAADGTVFTSGKRRASHTHTHTHTHTHHQHNILTPSSHPTTIIIIHTHTLSLHATHG
jgi:hypothetical protein